MDKSGDGKLSKSEINELFINLELDKEEEINYDEIINNADGIGNQGLICYKDFLLCSINLDKKSFIKYMKVAFKIYFKNEIESMTINEFQHSLREDKYITSAVMKQFIHIIDEDQSLTITSYEFFSFFIAKL